MGVRFLCHFPAFAPSVHVAACNLFQTCNSILFLKLCPFSWILGGARRRGRGLGGGFLYAVVRKVGAMSVFVSISAAVWQFSRCQLLSTFSRRGGRARSILPYSCRDMRPRRLYFPALPHTFMSVIILCVVAKLPIRQRKGGVACGVFHRVSNLRRSGCSCQLHLQVAGRRG